MNFRCTLCGKNNFLNRGTRKRCACGIEYELSFYGMFTIRSRAAADKRDRQRRANDALGREALRVFAEFLDDLSGNDNALPLDK